MICKTCGSNMIQENCFNWKGKFIYNKCECGMIFKTNMIEENQYLNDESYRDYMFRETEMYKDFEHIILYIKKIKKSGKLLDVGCNYGLLMNVAQDYGYKVSGIEPSLSCVKYGKDRFGFDIIHGILEEPTQEKYDIITMNHVLEHTTDPVKTLKAAHASLNDDGIIVLAFPNFGCEKAQKDPPNWGYLMADTHNYQFTLENATKVLLLAGFDLIWNPELTENLVLIGRKSTTIPIVNIKRFEKDHVDIILPIHNGEYTKNFIKGLYETADYPFKLYIIDDCSTDGTSDYIRNEVLPNHKEVVYLRNEVNQGFLKSVNLGIQASENDFVLIVNNDLEFMDRGWLSTSVGVLKNNVDIGAVGIEQLHRHVDFISMCYFMTRRSIMERIGLLDERYAPGVFEDVDYCTRLQMYGYGIVAVGLPVNHINNNGPQGDKTKDELDQINHNKFLVKYNFIDRDYKTVLHINNQLYVGGIEEVIKNLVKYKDNGYEIIVASPQDGRMSKELKDYGATVFTGSTNRIYNMMNLIKPDIVHTHTSGALSFWNHLANSLVPKPVRIETIHSPGTCTATKENLDMLVSVSEDTNERQTYENRRLILNGVDFDKCKYDENYVTDITKVVIGKICRFAKEKKVVDFILAAYLLSQKYNNLEFCLVGDSADRVFKDRCVLFSKQLGLNNMKFLSETRETRFMNGWNIGLAPTFSEGFGIATAEMVAMGMPVVTYNCFANPEIVIDGENGFLVEVDDINGLVKKTSELIESLDLRLAMSKKGLEYIKKFDARMMSKQYYDLYEELLGAKNGI